MRSILADALDCFWNAAIGEAHNRQSAAAMDTASVMATGFAAVAARLREEPAVVVSTTDVDSNGEHIEALVPVSDFTSTLYRWQGPRGGYLYDTCEPSWPSEKLDVRVADGRSSERDALLVELKQCAKELEEAAKIITGNGFPGLGRIYSDAQHRVQQTLKRAGR